MLGSYNFQAIQASAAIRYCASSYLIHSKHKHRGKSFSAQPLAFKVAGQSRGAPASNQRLITARSSSVICVALLKGMSLSTTACW